MPRKPPQRRPRRDIPEENRLIPPAGDESGIVVRDGEVEDFVPVRAVRLDQVGGGGVEEADLAVLGAREEVLACAGGEGEGVDGGGRCGMVW